MRRGSGYGVSHFAASSSNPALSCLVIEQHVLLPRRRWGGNPREAGGEGMTKSHGSSVQNDKQYGEPPTGHLSQRDLLATDPVLELVDHAAAHLLGVLGVARLWRLAGAAFDLLGLGVAGGSRG